MESFLSEEVTTLNCLSFYGVHGYLRFQYFLAQALDKCGSGTCSLLQFREMMRKFKIDLSEEDYFHLFSFYDKLLTGKVCYISFLRAHLEWRVRSIFRVIQGIMGTKYDDRLRKKIESSCIAFLFTCCTDIELLDNQCLINWMLISYCPVEAIHFVNLINVIGSEFINRAENSFCAVVFILYDLGWINDSLYLS